MNKNNEVFDKKNDEVDQWDVILSSIFVIILALGLLVTGAVVIGLTN